MRAGEKAKRQAQKKKEAAKKQANKPVPAKKDLPAKATKVLGSKQKVVWFNSSV